MQQYEQESRTLPGLAFGRLVEFSSHLVAVPVEIKTDEDIERYVERSIAELGRPKTVARKIANGEPLDHWEQRYGAVMETTLKGEAERLHRQLARRLHRELAHQRNRELAQRRNREFDRRPPRPSASVVRTVELTPLTGSFDRAARTLGDMPEGDVLTFTEFVELMLVRLYEADRQQPGEVIDLSRLAAELGQDVPEGWLFDAVEALADRGLVEDMRTMQTAHAILRGEGRLFVERGGSTGVIDEYRQHPANFVVVSGSGHQVAVATGGSVTQTSVQGAVPEEAWGASRSDRERDSLGR